MDRPVRWVHHVQSADNFHRPNRLASPAVGGALTAILISRLVYRFITLNALTAPDAQAGPPVNPWTTGQSSPLTLGIIAVLMGYYLVYFAGVLREGKKHGVA